MRSEAPWDAPGILAAVKRRGTNLTALAVKNGLSEAACRTSLTRAFPAADRVIAAFLGVPVHELWPDRYYPDGGRVDRRTVHFRAQNKPGGASAHCQKVRAA